VKVRIMLLSILTAIITSCSIMSELMEPGDLQKLIAELTPSAPVFHPAPGNFETNITVTITCANPSAAIYWSTNGGAVWEPLTAIRLEGTATILAKSVVAGKEAQSEARFGVFGVYNVDPGTSGYDHGFDSPFVYNGVLYFAGDDSASNSHIYSFDGTVMREVPVSSPDYKEYFFDPIIFEGRLYFKGNNNLGQSVIFYYDGVSIKGDTLKKGDYNLGYSEPIQIGSAILFGGADTNGNPEVFVLKDNTVTNIPLYPGCDYQWLYSSPFIFSNKIHFFGTGGGEGKLFKYDGNGITNASTNLSGYLEGIQGIIEFNGKIYFSGTSNTFNIFLYQYNGWEISKVSAGASGYKNGCDLLTLYKDMICFKGNNTSDKTVMFVYNAGGIEGGFTNIIQPQYAHNYYQFEDPIVFQDNLYFESEILYQSYTMLRFNGTHLSLITNHNTDYASGFRYPAVYNTGQYQWMIFSGKNSWYLWKLYKYNGNTLFAVPTGNSSFQRTGGYSLNAIQFYQSLYFLGENKFGKSVVFRYGY